MVTKNQENMKLMIILNHLSGIFFSFIGPLVFLLASEDKKVKEHARNALNWQISLLIYSIISFILIIVFIGILLLAVLGLLNIIFCIIAAIKASEDNLWTYPLSIPFFK